ncbi:DUF397 domain-containing protein [Embleya sp. NPDC056575]|uniref:DUF397 domain-containing protein n=1 Tax=unclassified Embleya TaxID=2699296 RepID=UPI003678ECBC
MNVASQAWRKPVASTGNDACVEVALLPTSTGVRDTKDRQRGHLEISPAAWGELLSVLTK